MIVLEAFASLDAGLFQTAISYIEKGGLNKI